VRMLTSSSGSRFSFSMGFLLKLNSSDRIILHTAGKSKTGKNGNLKKWKRGSPCNGAEAVVNYFIMEFSGQCPRTMRYGPRRRNRTTGLSRLVAMICPAYGIRQIRIDRKRKRIAYDEENMDLYAGSEPAVRLLR